MAADHLPAEKRRYRKDFAKEFAMAEKIAGVKPEWSPHAHEAFRINADGVTIICYPHRTSAGNYHIRVRDGGSKDKSKAAALMDKLDAESGSNCTFTRKTK